MRNLATEAWQPELDYSIGLELDLIGDPVGL